MADRWGDDGPPADAYSRVTRDAVAVTAGLGAWAQGLAGRLAALHEVVLREPTDAERDLAGRWGPRTDVHVLVPADPAAAPLVIGIGESATHGFAVTLVAGHEVIESVPTCLCDACDEVSDDLISVLSEVVDAATTGFQEYRRLGGWDGQQPEHGFEWADGGGSAAPRPGELFEQTWSPWPPRR